MRCERSLTALGAGLEGAQKVLAAGSRLLRC